MTMHRRPLGQGRTMAALAGVVILVGCVLPWWQLGGGEGLPLVSGNAFEGSGIIVFGVGIATLALVALPYASERPTGIDRWLSFAHPGRRRLGGPGLARGRPADDGRLLVRPADRDLHRPARPVGRRPGAGHPVPGRVPDDPRAGLPLRAGRRPRATLPWPRVGSAAGRALVELGDRPPDRPDLQVPGQPHPGRGADIEPVDPVGQPAGRRPDECQPRLPVDIEPSWCRRPVPAAGRRCAARSTSRRRRRG